MKTRHGTPAGAPQGGSIRTSVSAMLRRAPAGGGRSAGPGRAAAFASGLRGPTRVLRVAALVCAAALGPVPAAGQNGTMDTLSIDSPRLQRPIAVRIYRPGRTDRPCLPLLLLLHGLDGNETSWERLGGIRRTLDGMIADGRLRPLLVVMPGAGNSWYVDSAAAGGPGDVESALLGDLLPAVAARYAVCPGRSARAVAGLSMGGYGALRLALAHPDVFGAAAALSPAIWQNVPADELDLPPDRITVLAKSRYFHRSKDGDVTAGIVLPRPGRHYAGAFGTPFDARRFNRLNPFTLLETAAAAGGTTPALFVTVGDDDSLGLWEGGIAFFETARMLGVPLEFRITDGDHVWSLWRRSIVEALLFLDGHLDDRSAR